MATHRDPQTTPCPRCGQPVYRRAIQCPHCQSNLFLDNEVRTRVLSHRLGSRAPRSRAPLVIVLWVAAAAVVALAGWWYVGRVLPPPRPPRPAASAR